MPRTELRVAPYPEAEVQPPQKTGGSSSIERGHDEAKMDNMTLKANLIKVLTAGLNKIQITKI